jgi:hypothetical protein
MNYRKVYLWLSALGLISSRAVVRCRTRRKSQLAVRHDDGSPKRSPHFSWQHGPLPGDGVFSSARKQKGERYVGCLVEGVVGVPGTRGKAF